ncbi:MAG: hypothetical protein PHY47_24080 [Lachnospiraceae bacterium]|nr:hypothetical protein [Lachnospiraceae bacterium]
MGLFKDMKTAVKSYSNIKVKEKLDYDRLYEIIKDGNYPLAKPEITGSGIMRAIRFDATGKYQIMVAISGKIIAVSKSYSGVGGFAKEMVGDALTGGWFNTLNKENIDGNEAVEEIGKEISRLLEQENLLA